MLLFCTKVLNFWSDETFSTVVEKYSTDIGSRISVKILLTETFDSDFPAQFYLKTCTVYDGTGKEFNVVEKGCSSDLTQTKRHTSQEKLY